MMWDGIDTDPPSTNPFSVGQQVMWRGRKAVVIQVGRGGDTNAVTIKEVGVLLHTDTRACFLTALTQTH